MKTKKILLILTLMIGVSSVKTTFAGEPSNGTNLTAAAIVAAVTGVIGGIASLSTIMINYQTYNHNKDKNDAEAKKLRLDVNSGYLNSMSSSDTAIANNATAQKNINQSDALIKKQLTENQKKIINLNEFYRQGKGDKEYFDPEKSYGSQDSQSDTTKEESIETQKVPELSFFN